MFFPLTFVSMVTGAFVMFAAWFYTGYRARNKHVELSPSVRLFRQFFLAMGIFFLIIWISHLWLTFDPGNFPLAAAIGYTVGHVFSYLALIAMARMTCILVPRLASKERAIVAGAIVFGIIVTIVTAVTMIWGARPSFDYVNNVTNFNAAPIVGILIGIYGLLTFIPATVLLLINGFKSHGSRRVRSLLLGTGLLVIIVTGLIHDNAHTSTLYVSADIIMVIGILMIGAGVAYRIGESMQPAAVPVIVPSSNTV